MVDADVFERVVADLRTLTPLKDVLLVYVCMHVGTGDAVTAFFPGGIDFQIPIPFGLPKN